VFISTLGPNDTDADARAILVRPRAELPVHGSVDNPRDHDLDDKLIGLERRLVVPDDELLDGDLTSTTRAPDNHTGPESTQHGRWI
jgi:hypothetical protein